MGNLWGNLFVTLKWGMNHRIQAVWDRLWRDLSGQLEGIDPGADGPCGPLKPCKGGGRRWAIWGMRVCNPPDAGQTSVEFHAWLRPTRLSATQGHQRIRGATFPARKG